MFRITNSESGIIEARASRNFQTPARVLGRFAGVGLIVFMAVLAGGCGNTGGGALAVDSSSEFNQYIEGDKPTLMLFYKQGCATCAVLEPTIDQLAGEYQGRAVVAKIMILTFTFGNTFQDIHDKYEIGLVPVVILFVHGQEKQRWLADYSIDHYRTALNAVVPGPPASSPTK